jgi:hypothetical protein
VSGDLRSTGTMRDCRSRSIGRWCSPKANVLIMRAARPIEESQFLELRRRGEVPVWDYMPGGHSSPLERKASDWGWLGGRLVAVDYGANGNVDPADIEKALHERRPE